MPQAVERPGKGSCLNHDDVKASPAARHRSLYVGIASKTVVVDRAKARSATTVFEAIPAYGDRCQAAGEAFTSS